MKEINYLVKFNNSTKDKDLIIADTAHRILKDWELDAYDLGEEKLLQFFLFLDEKSKMVYQNLEGHDNPDENIDLYTDICLLPQNVVYEDIGFKNSLSLTINVNEIKASVAEICLILLSVFGVKLSNLSSVAVNLLVLLIKNIKYIPNDVNRCVLNIIVNNTVKVNPQKENITINEILSFFEDEYICPNMSKKCTYFGTNNRRCNLTKNQRENEIHKAIDNLLFIKAIQCPDPNSNNPHYNISHLIIKE